MAQRVAHYINPSWPKPVKFFGGGVNGRVYETTDGRLMKFIYDNAPQEYTSLRKLQGTFTVPRFKKGDGAVKKLDQPQAVGLKKMMFPNANLSNKLTVFVMGRAGNSSAMTLYQYIKKYPGANTSNIQRRVEYLIKEMALRGVSHGDLHANNIIVNVSPTGRITGMWAIDFGRSRKMAPGNTERETFGKLKYNRLVRTGSIFPPYIAGNVPFRNRSRANVHMMNVSYGKRLSPEWERKIANMRKEVLNEMKQYKSPKQTTSPRKTKSLSLPKRTPSPARPKSAPGRIATPQKGLKVRLSLKRRRSVAP